MSGDRDRFVDDLVRELRAEQVAEEAARVANQSAADAEHAALIAADLPCRVRVAGHPTDHYAQTVDVGRTGWVRQQPTQNTYGSWRAYVEDLGPGEHAGDRNPTRYHQARHLYVIDARTS